MLAAVTIFLSAFLLFFVQPFLGKALLPVTGGAAAGWLSLLVFFQLVLLAGYVLAWGLARLSARRHGLAVWLVLAIGALFLPLHVSQAQSLDSAEGVLRLLLQVVAVPAFALSMLSTTIQRLATADSRNPYVLYAASNTGSLLGLLTYPLLVEPFLPLEKQAWVWAGAYVVLIGLFGSLVYRSKDMPASGQGIVTGWRLRGLWLALAAVPASLSYGLTSYITTELGSFPLFWVVPLAGYLLSFIIAFAGQPSQGRLQVLSGFALAGFMALGGLSFAQLNGQNLMPDAGLMAISFLAFLLLATALHSRLAQARPQPEALGEYYIWLAAGGALGGLFNVFLVPFLFTYPVEFFMAGAVALCLLEFPARFSRALRRLAVAGMVLAFALLQIMQHLPAQHSERNFFGTIIVFDAPDEQGSLTRYVTTGLGYQGSQRLEPEPDRVPRLYFTPLQAFFTASRYKSIGMLGVGAGMALCFTAPGRSFTVYELDPKMRRIAERDFTYIRDCGVPEWHMGDGRIELARDADKRFDVLIIDAFHGANIPLHLLTREALTLYRSRLSPEGVLLYNINSVYYDLYPQLAAQAREIGWQVWQAPYAWVLMAPPEVDMAWLAGIGWSRVERPPVRVWRDDWASPLSALAGRG